MNTKYGEIPDETLITYIDGMISKVFRMLPMKEECSSTLDVYMKATLREFIGNKELIDEFRNDENLLVILGVLESLLTQDDLAEFKSDIFKIINLIKKMRSSLDGDVQ